MNLRNVLKTYSLLRTLGDDETALLNTLRGMNESERELLVESLSPTAAKKAADAKKRNLEHCGVCDYTRRAIQHKDVNHKDFHEFHTRTERPPKSPRASSLQQQIQSTRATTSKPVLCTYELNGKACHGAEGDGVHDESMGYAAYHEFQPAEQAASASGD